MSTQDNPQQWSLTTTFAVQLLVVRTKRIGGETWVPYDEAVRLLHQLEAARAHPPAEGST